MDNNERDAVLIVGGLIAVALVCLGIGLWTDWTWPW
jgi:hypothetical protein